MTLIIGYVYKDTVQVVVDSAGTLIGDTSSIRDSEFAKTTSFGELVSNDENDSVVIENAQKLFALHDGILCAISGSVYEAISIVRDLETVLKFRKTEISSVLLDFFSTLGSVECNFILAFYENNIPMLFSYVNSKQFGFCLRGSLIALGSGSENYVLTTHIELALNQFINVEDNKLSSDELLVSVISILQSNVINTKTFREGVGGVINGAYVGNKGIEWAKDTIYAVYSDKHYDKTEPFFVFKLNRENVLTTISSYNRKLIRKSFFPDGFSEMELFLERWKLIFNSIYFDLKATYYVFLSYDRRIITVLPSYHFAFNNIFKIIGYDETQKGFRVVPNDYLVWRLTSRTEYYAQKLDEGAVDFFWIPNSSDLK